MAAKAEEELDPEGFLNNNQAERKVWLMKVPTFVATAWKKLPTGEDSELGRVIVSIDPLAADATPEFSLQLVGPATATIPKDYALQKTNEETMTYLFSEVPRGGVSVDGRVDNRFDMKPKSMGDAEYQKLLVERMNKFTTKVRQVQVLNDDKGRYMQPIPVDISGRDKRPQKEEAWRTKRERKSKGEVELMLFRMFEKETHWGLKQLVDETNQPQAFLKEVLNEICIFNKRGPSSGTYELKEEYRKNDAGGSGGS